MHRQTLDAGVHQVVSKRKHSFFIVDGLVWEMGLSVYALGLYNRLCYRAGSSGEAFESLDKMAAAIGIGRTKVKQALRELVDRSMVTVEARTRDDGSQTTNLITLTDQTEWSRPDTTPPEAVDPPVVALSSPCRRPVASEKPRKINPGVGRETTPPSRITTPPQSYYDPLELDPYEQDHRINKDQYNKSRRPPPTVEKSTPSNQKPESFQDPAAQNCAGIDLQSSKSLKLVDDEKPEGDDLDALAAKWCEWANSVHPWQTSYSPSSFAKALRTIKTKAGVETSHLEALLGFIRQDKFWVNNAISPVALLKRSRNADCYKWEMVLSAMMRDKTTRTRMLKNQLAAEGVEAVF